ncbi:tyrosine-type recombinase/integrase [Streptosporangium sandarakinum]
MARRTLIRGMGSLKTVDTCTHGPGKTYKNGCTRCPVVGRFRDLTGDDRAKTFSDYDEGWQFLFDNFNARRQRKGKPTVSKGRAPTIADYTTEWLARARHLSAASVRGYRSYLKNHINPAIGDISVKDLTHDRVAELIDDMYQVRLRDFTPSGKPRPGSKPRAVYEGTIEAIVKYLMRPVFAKVVKDGWRTDNPFDDHKLRKAPDAKRYRPTGDEVHQIADAINPFWRLAIYLMSAAGMRQGEVLATTTAVLDQPDRIWVGRQWRQDSTYGPPKYHDEGGGRYVPLDPFLRAEIERHIELFHIEPGELLFASPVRPNMPAGNQAMDKAIRDARLVTGLNSPDKRITAHNFRHAFAANMIKCGVDLGEVSKMLGHASYETTYKIYFDLLDSSWEKYNRAANSWLSATAPADRRGVGAYAEEEKADRIAALRAELAALGVALPEDLTTAA